MQEAKIDKQGTLYLVRKNEDRRATCPIMSDGKQDLWCGHDCPGWQDDQFRRSNKWLPCVTLLCMPGKPTFEIVSDERVK